MPTTVVEPHKLVDGLKELVETAEKATGGLEDLDLRRVAFEHVLNHLLRNGAAAFGTNRPSGTQARPADMSVGDADGVFGHEQQRTDAIATYFKVMPNDVPHLFDVTGEIPFLTLHSSNFHTANAAATRQIALLVTGARTALGQQTTTSDIRGIVEQYGRLDSSNFMSSLANMAELSVLGKTRSSNRVVRMKVLGVDKARELAQRLIGE